MIGSLANKEIVRAAECFSPGDHLAEELQARGWTVDDLSERMSQNLNEKSARKYTPLRMSELLSAERALTPGDALRLARVLGTSADFWIALQESYLLWLHEQDRQRGVIR
jgi:HTH-type transcriptional regulator/antitoxin HigA